MAGREKSGQEILLEQLALRVSQLTAEQKAKEAAIKELNSQLYLTETETTKKIAAKEAECARHCAALQQEIKPLEELKRTCVQLKSEIEKLKRDKVEAVSDVRQARAGAIKEMDEKAAKAAKRLTAIEQRIADCQQKVMNL